MCRTQKAPSLCALQQWSMLTQSMGVVITEWHYCILRRQSSHFCFFGTVHDDDFSRPPWTWRSCQSCPALSALCLFVSLMSTFPDRTGSGLFILCAMKKTVTVGVWARHGTCRSILKNRAVSDKQTCGAAGCLNSAWCSNVWVRPSSSPTTAYIQVVNVNI